MQVLITGANGQLARALSRLHPEWTFAPRSALDITDPSAVTTALSALRPDVVVNAAAYTAVDRAEDDAAAAWRINADGPAVLAAAAAQRGAALVQVSTDYVFGDGVGPRAPGDPTGPLNVYGASKLAGEEAVRAGLARHVILRTAWVFGPDRAGFVGAIAKRCRLGLPLRVVSDVWGNPTPADGLAAAVAAVVAACGAAARGDGGPGDGARVAPWGTWHAAGQPATTWAGLAEAVVAELGYGGPVEAIRAADWPTPARRPADARLDTAAFEEAFGVRIDWRAGLRGCGGW
jgi:dTDP-4-dehydrorhamnose reductase